jgi:hypothetical protein
MLNDDKYLCSNNVYVGLFAAIDCQLVSSKSNPESHLIFTAALLIAALPESFKLSFSGFLTSLPSYLVSTRNYIFILLYPISYFRCHLP